MTSEQWLGVHTGGVHYLDHLGILCEGLDIPLIVTEPKTFQAAQQFYPHLQIKYRDLSELSLDFLAHAADVIFESGHHFALELIPLWELMHGKKMRVVYCPHGNSDKKYHSRKDISLIYGDHMHHHLQKTEEIDRLEKTIVTGNYRLAYYETHQTWYDQKLNQLLQHHINPHRKNVFYAPTWDEKKEIWLEQSLRVIEEVGQHFNLLLRWHPFLDDLYPAASEKIKQRCKEVQGVVNLSSFPCIYPILNRSDFYLGDFSSIGYDFLSFDKPLFFLDRNEGEISKCGATLTKDTHWGQAIAQFQDSAAWSEKRTQLASKVFGNKRSFQTIKTDLKQALQEERISWLAVDP